MCSRDDDPSMHDVARPQQRDDLVRQFTAEIGVMAPWMDKGEVRRWAERLAEVVAGWVRTGGHPISSGQMSLPPGQMLAMARGVLLDDDPTFPSPALVEKVDREFR
jgi:hypothetical protein